MSQGIGVRSSTLILVYHRVADLPTDPNAIAVRPDLFEGHLEILRRDYEPLSLHTLADGLRKARIPGRGVVVTFDDGYSDNLTCARPILDRYEIPATVFVVSGQVGATREFWWDELEQIVLGPAPLPEDFAIEMGFRMRRFAVGPDATWTDAERSRHSGWNVRSAINPTARHRVFRELSECFRDLHPDDVQRALADLRRQAECAPIARASHAALDVEQLAAMAADGLIDIGAHTVSHPMLKTLKPDERRREIEHSRNTLEAWLGRRIRSFAYPFGRASGSTALVRDAGFEAACSTRPAAVSRRTNPLRLPRMYVGNWEPAEFESRLQAAL